MSTWIYHPGLDVHSEIEDESLPVWLENGWQESPGPAPDTSRYSESELAARAAQLGAPQVAAPVLEVAAEPQTSGQDAPTVLVEDDSTVDGS